MRYLVLGVFLGVSSLALTASPAGAEVLTVSSILTAQKAGAPTDGMIAMINDPANTVGMSAGDLVTFRDAESVAESPGLPPPVLETCWRRG